MSSLRPARSLSEAPLASRADDLAPIRRWRILIVDDDPDDAKLVEDILRAGQLDDLVVDWRSNITEGLEALSTSEYTACIVDFHMGSDSGLTFIDSAQLSAPTVPVLLLTGQLSRDLDIAAMNAGAADFLHKGDLNKDSLERSIRYAVENARRRARLELMARRDPLTGLHNRASIIERVRQAAFRARKTDRSMALMMLDLDGFKAVNDTRGHAVGDELLILVAERLKGTLRDYDVVGRLGGDEFVAVVEDLADAKEADFVAERLVEAIRPPYELSTAIPPVTASVGYVSFPGSIEEPAELLEAADQAMYTAKRQGKAKAHRFSSTSSCKLPQIVSSGCIRSAMSKGELRLAVQPQVNLQTGALVGMESYVRLKEGCHRDCAADDVIKDLVQTCSNRDVDMWIVERAIGLREKFGSGFRIAVNLSPIDLEDPDFLDKLKAIMPKAADLEVELSETTLRLDRPSVRSGIQTLMKLGIRLAIDDFGTGYSSLARLQDLPVHTIKIDKSFVHRLTDKVENAAIVESIAVLGRPTRCSSHRERCRDCGSSAPAA